MPCLLLKNNGLFKTVKFKNPMYIGDPINTVRIFNEKEVDELVLLDIEATVEKRSPPFDLLYQIAGECFMPLSYGGGIKDIQTMKEIFNIGVEKVIINTCAHENPSLIQNAVQYFGEQSIVGSVDVKKNIFGYYKVYTNSGRKKTDYDPVQYACQLENLGVGELLLNSIDKDGTMEGFDLQLIKAVSEVVSVPVIASGGAGKVQDIINAIAIGGASGIAAGSMFVYQGKHRAVLINYPDVSEVENLIGGV